MTETPTNEAADVEAQVPSGPESVKCNNCGKKHELMPGDDADWLCPKCEHYQDQTVCPTCHSVVKASLMGGHK